MPYMMRGALEEARSVNGSPFYLIAKVRDIFGDIHKKNIIFQEERSMKKKLAGVGIVAVLSCAMAFAAMAGWEKDGEKDTYRFDS